jgi:hypothetical protein
VRQQTVWRRLLQPPLLQLQPLPNHWMMHLLLLLLLLLLLPGQLVLQLAAAPGL